jgi:two-component system NarL family response regulator
MTIKISIVEDDPLLRNSMSVLLRGEQDMAVEGLYASAAEAISSVREPVPDVLIVDIGLPDRSGVDVIRQIKGRFPRIEIMAHTVFDDRETVFSALKAGASGYLLKRGTPRELIDALHDLVRGGSPMSPAIARRVILEFQDKGVCEQYVLSQREKEIVAEIEKGMSYKKISEKFAISPHTVHTHINNIYKKLQAKDRREALVIARQKGII